MPIPPAGKDQTYLIPAMRRKLSCHILVTHAPVINCVRSTTGKNAVRHKDTIVFALARWSVTKLSVSGRFVEVRGTTFL